MEEITESVKVHTPGLHGLVPFDTASARLTETSWEGCVQPILAPGKESLFVASGHTFFTMCSLRPADRVRLWKRRKDRGRMGSEESILKIWKEHVIDAELHDARIVGCAPPGCESQGEWPFYVAFDGTLVELGRNAYAHTALLACNAGFILYSAGGEKLRYAMRVTKADGIRVSQLPGWIHCGVVLVRNGKPVALLTCGPAATSQAGRAKIQEDVASFRDGDFDDALSFSEAVGKLFAVK